MLIRRPISWTSPPSIGTYVHHVLSTLPASQLENRVFRIEGDRKTWQEIIKIWEKKHAKKAQIHCRTEDEIRKFRDAQTSLLPIFASYTQEDGSAWNGGEDNAVWPDWNPLKWEDVMY